MRVLSLLLPLIALALALLLAAAQAAQARPNIILIITDDQGYGDLGAHGNTMIRTPHLDRLHSQSVRLTNYHVDPTCSPTRAALMTGRYSTKTGVWHTIAGRSMMAHDEVTLPQLFKDRGYRTAMFGKWHLGDNYPTRPQDRGFDESLIHGGGGVTQTPDYWGNDYFDDTYFRNGKPEKVSGYCTDVFFDNALKFIEGNKGEPFFCYIATNAPHAPFLVADKYSQPYKDKGVPSPMAEFYGMITNIDENVGRLRQRLKELGLEENTLLIFTTDNGTAAGAPGRGGPKGKAGEAKAGDAGQANGWRGFNTGMRGTKGSEYDGGHRVPCFFYWPAHKLTGGRDVNVLTGHIDIMPTLASFCGIKPPQGRCDGQSLEHWLTEELSVPSERTPEWSQRAMFVHSQRVETPQKWKQSAVMTPRWRLVNGKELYDIKADPGQTKNIAADHAEVVSELREAYEKWWQDLSPAFDRYVPVVIGGNDEPVRLTAHDWHAEAKDVPWNHAMIERQPHANGWWAVEVAKAGEYEVALRTWPPEMADAKALTAKSARLQVGEMVQTQPVKQGTVEAVFRMKLPAGPARLRTELTDADGQSRGAFYVLFRRVE